jgi:hypothetical protein
MEISLATCEGSHRSLAVHQNTPRGRFAKDDSRPVVRAQDYAVTPRSRSRLRWSREDEGQASVRLPAPLATSPPLVDIGRLAAQQSAAKAELPTNTGRGEKKRG